MCGVTGFVDFGRATDGDVLKQMTTSLKHRGPDGCGAELFHNTAATVGLGHTRLAVLDLTDAGHQPMRYRHYSITYNGEIYNFAAVRKVLEQKGHIFKSRTDTEVILQAFEEWGADCVQHFIGMFAFALYDHQCQKLYAFRDRTGVKPFFYYHHNSLLLFGSELKSLHQHPGFVKSINSNALSTYFHLGYIPAPQTIYDHTYKLLPGHYFECDLMTQRVLHHCYWNPAEFYSRPKRSISFPEAKTELYRLFASSVEYRMVSDVPVGVFLSAGYDSTAVAVLLQKERTQKLKTFTIGFDYGNNEAPAARETATYLGTDHHEWICTAREAQEIIPDLPLYYDEPFADSSAIPTMLVSRFARQHVTVALSADGGDELFAGYKRHARWLCYLRSLEKLPALCRPPLSILARGVSHMLPRHLPHRRHHLEVLAACLQMNGKERAGRELYKQMHLMPSSLVQRLLKKENGPALGAFISDFELADLHEHVLLVDYLTYLPDDILVKVDRATMSVGLEGREPLLDHRLLEWVAQMPFSYKLDQHGESKKLLRSMVHDLVPRELMHRPKSGFSIPFSKWFRGDLNDLLMDLLSPEQVSKSGLLDVGSVSQHLRQFNQGKLHYTPLIWKLLVFQMWWNSWMCK